MFIGLETIDVWLIKEGFSPRDFLMSLDIICQESDVLVFGSYGIADEIRDFLIKHEVPVEQIHDFIPFYSSDFDLNRDEYPNGRFYAINPKKEILPQLADFSELKNGGSGIDLFFTHVLAYRKGEPYLPLFDFHDAFIGGELRLTSLYLDETVVLFAKKLKAKFRKIWHPSINFLVEEYELKHGRKRKPQFRRPHRLNNIYSK